MWKVYETEHQTTCIKRHVLESSANNEMGDPDPRD